MSDHLNLAEAEYIVGDVLATLDCLYTLDSTGDIDSLLHPTLNRLLSDSITRLIRLHELLTPPHAPSPDTA